MRKILLVCAFLLSGCAWFKSAQAPIADVCAADLAADSVIVALAGQIGADVQAVIQALCSIDPVITAYTDNTVTGRAAAEQVLGVVAPLVTNLESKK